MLKRALAVVIGLASAHLVVTGIEALSRKRYPVPATLDPQNVEAIKHFIATMPTGAFALVLVAYAFGSLSGGLVAGLVAGRRSMVPPLVVGGILTLAGMMNLMSLPHPLWFAISSSMTYLPLALVGGRLVWRAS